jgi:hypothetical protein
MHIVINEHSVASNKLERGTFGPATGTSVLQLPDFQKWFSSLDRSSIFECQVLDKR